MIRPLSAPQLAADIGLAAVFTTVAQVQLFVPNDDGYVGGPIALNVVVMALTTVPLAMRRLRPRTTVVVMFSAQILVSLVSPHTVTFWGTLLPVAIAIYSAARWSPPRTALPLLVLPVLFMPTYGIHMPEFRGWEDYAFMTVVVAAAWGAGQVIASLTDQRRRLDRALVELTEQRDQQRQQALLEERARIAREMHDVVAHGVSVMVVQAGAARMDLDESTDDARASLLSVEATGREVLAELRRTVSLLRSPHEAAPVAQPSPGLADLPDLVDSMRAAGLQVQLDLHDVPAADPGRQLVVYRVVQEALTNTLRHAGPTRVDVRIGGDRDLTVEICDSGPPPGQGVSSSGTRGGGNGLVGMRERIALYGGRFHAGPDGAGYVVRAAIPAEPAP